MRNRSNSPAEVAWLATVQPSASPLTSPINLSASGSIGDAQPDTYAFTANAGTQLFYQFQGNGWTQGRLVAPDGTTTTLNSPSTLWLTQTGNYTLEVTGSPSGTYNFDLRELPQGTRGAGYLELNSRVSGTLDGNRAKVYAFEGAEGVRLLFNRSAKLPSGCRTDSITSKRCPASFVA